MTNIKLIKLATGMEFVGDWQDHVLKRAFQVLVQPVNDQQYKLGLVPIAVSIEDAQKGVDVTPPLAQLLGIYNPTTELRDVYCKLTGNIIVSPPTSLFE